MLHHIDDVFDQFDIKPTKNTKLSIRCALFTSAWWLFNIFNHSGQAQRCTWIRPSEGQKTEFSWRYFELKYCVFFLQNINNFGFSDENEALSTLKVAVELKLQGKMDKALRLFQHALALAPKHPEVLNKYGECLEHHYSDVISADQMYFQVSNFNWTQSTLLLDRKSNWNKHFILSCLGVVFKSPT